MKRLLLGALVLVMMLAGCTNSDEVSSATPSPATTVELSTSTSKPTPEPIMESDMIEAEIGELRFSYPETWEFVADDEGNCTITVFAKAYDSDKMIESGFITISATHNERDILTNKDLERYQYEFLNGLGFYNNTSAILSVVHDADFAGQAALYIPYEQGSKYDCEAYATVRNDKTYTVIYGGARMSEKILGTVLSDFHERLEFTKPELPEEEVSGIAAARFAEIDRAAAEKAELRYNEEKENLANALTIYSITTSKPNSADGVDLTIKWSNNSEKTIKYVTFAAEAINAVDDVVECEIRDYSLAHLEDTGPYDKDTKITSHADNTWYNKTIKKARLHSVEIEYVDGSSEYIRGSIINYEWIK